MKILVTGGAGFIGSHLVDGLLARGHDVRVFDSLEPQVHGNLNSQPSYLAKGIEFVRGDLRDRDAVKKALAGIEIVFHEGSAVGVGQSMYQIQKYVEVNCLGTANLLDVIVQEKLKVQKLVLASSMSNYGEGKYHCKKCGDVFPKLRSAQRLEQFFWESACPRCGQDVSCLPTDEEKPLFPTSVYATTKRDQEEMFCEIGDAYGIPTAVLRYFNVYGERQALGNPYTGIIAIISNCLLAGQAPVIFEDGRQTRDFIHVSDIVQANLLALEKHNKGVQIYNIGTGNPTNVMDLYQALRQELCPKGAPPANLVKRSRVGDIRHCYADITRIKKVLGYQPKVTIQEGVKRLNSWAANQKPSQVQDRAIGELKMRGLIK